MLGASVAAQLHGPRGPSGACAGGAIYCVLTALACTPYAPGSEVILPEEGRPALQAVSVAEGDAGIAAAPAPGRDWSCLGELVEGRDSVLDTFEAEAEGFVPVMDFPAAVEQDTLQFGYAMMPLTVVPQLAEVNQISLIEGMAIVALTAADCQGARAPQVAFSNDVGGLVFYFVDDFPYQGRTSTSQDGAGGFVDVPVGSVVARAVLEESSTQVRTRVLLTRANWASYAHLAPLNGAPAPLPDL